MTKEFDFKLERDKYDTIGKLSFSIRDTTYNFKFEVHTPDCDDSWDKVNSYYFKYYKVNEFGASLGYTEYVDVFDKIINELGQNKEYITLFDLNIKKEFVDVDRQTLTILFSNMNKYIIDRVKEYYSL